MLADAVKVVDDLEIVDGLEDVHDDLETVLDDLETDHDLEAVMGFSGTDHI